MKTRRQRKGFTLVELLVVITIIGMLMALLLPAIQAAREAGRRATCMNNQRNLGMAMLDYDSARNIFPGMINEVGRYSNGAPYFGSWIVPILPYLERSDVYELWTTLETSTTPPTPKHLMVDASGKLQGFVNIPLLTCPSNPTVASPGQAPNGYRVNAGRRGPSSPSQGSEIQDTTNCGVFDLVSPFLAAAHGAGTKPAITNTALSIDGIRDGAAHTLMLSENTREGDSWTDGCSLDVGNGVASDTGNLWKRDDTYDTQKDTFYKCEAALGFRIPWSKTSAEGLEFPINKNIDGRPTEPRGASPASYHPGGVIVTFCDGHVQFLEEQIETNTYMHLMTPNGKRAREWGIANSLDYYNEMYGVLDETN